MQTRHWHEGVTPPEPDDANAVVSQPFALRDRSQSQDNRGADRLFGCGCFVGLTVCPKPFLTLPILLLVTIVIVGAICWLVRSDERREAAEIAAERQHKKLAAAQAERRAAVISPKQSVGAAGSGKAGKGAVHRAR
jgi:hypothetical protein